MTAIEVTDPDVFEQYRRAVPAVDEKYGGRYVGRGGTTVTLEGDWIPNRLVIVEFADMDSLMTWYNSPEYAPLLQLRKKSANSRVIAFEGV